MPFMPLVQLGILYFFVTLMLLGSMTATYGGDAGTVTRNRWSWESHHGCSKPVASDNLSSHPPFAAVRAETPLVLTILHRAMRSDKDSRIHAARSRCKILLERNPKSHVQGWIFKSSGQSDV